MSIFYDHFGNFQWASIAAIIAGCTAVVSFVFSFLSFNNSKKSLDQQREMAQKKIDADIISKSRVEWIDTTRTCASSFISETHKAVSLILFISDLNLKRLTSLENFMAAQKIVYSQEQQLNTSVENLNRYYILLKLNFSNNKVHNEIVDTAFVMSTRINLLDFNSFYTSDLEKATKEHQLLDECCDEIMDHLNNLVDLLREFYEVEWNRVKAGE